MNEYRDFYVNKRDVDAGVSRFELLLAALGLSVIAGALVAAIIAGDAYILQLFRALAAVVAGLGVGALLWEAVKWEKPEEQRSTEKERTCQPASARDRTQRGSRAA